MVVEITKQNYRSFNDRLVSYTDIELNKTINGIIHFTSEGACYIFNNISGYEPTFYYKKLYNCKYQNYIGVIHYIIDRGDIITFLDDNNTNWWFIN